MSSFSKENQLSKNRTKNPKKLSAVELADYKNFIYAKQGGKCFCGCGSVISEFHHSKRGAYKDDRSLVGINRACHSLIHNCEYKNLDKTSRLTLLAKKVGTQHWKDYVCC